MQDYLVQIIATAILLVTFPLIKYIAKKLIRKYAALSEKLESRTNQIIRILAISINLTFFITLILIWGVNPRNLLVAISSIFAVIGVALFAQWSMLSNVTAGIIIFFSAPFRIGDYIRVVDKESPIEAYVEDILTFHTVLRTRQHEIIFYPNSLFFQKGIAISHVSNWDNEDLV